MTVHLRNNIVKRVRHYGIAALMLSLIVAAISVPPAASRTAPRFERLGLGAMSPEAVPHEIIVSYRAGTSVVAELQARPSFRDVRRIGRRTALVTVSADVPVEDALRILDRDPRVVFAEPNYRRYLAQSAPNDPRFQQQWSFENTGQPHVLSGSDRLGEGTPGADINALEAWSTTSGSDQTVIAILDSGVDVSHPDLAANMWTNPGEIPGNFLDDDNNGHIDDVHGWDFAEDDGSVFEPNSAYAGYEHGTHVAGTAAAVADNNEGVAGVCPRCKIMVLKVFEPVDTNSPPDGLGDTMMGDAAALVEGIEYAIEMGADVINGSVAAPLLWSAAEYDALKRATEAGISPVFAAGNFRGDNDLLMLLDFDGDGGLDSLSPLYPASYDIPGLISVGASNHHDRNGYMTACSEESGVSDWHCSFTNVGRESVDVVAPGVDIISSVPGGYAPADGTSMAAPHVAGIAGLIHSLHPDYNAVQVRNALINSVDKPGALNTLYSFPDTTANGSFTASGGRVDAAAALTASTTDQLPRTDGDIAGARRIKRMKQGAVAWPADANDVYKKRLKAGVSYRVVLDGPKGADFDLLIWMPGTKQIWQLESGCFAGDGRCQMLLPYAPEPDADETRMVTPDKSGKYYFQVSAFLLNQGTYKLKVRKV